MKPVDQTVFTVPGGNCFSACLASLLELPLEDVPYFMGDEPPDQPSAWFELLSDWLRPRGWWAIPIPVGNGWKPEGLCILSGKSPRGDFDHCVVAHGLKVVHDPHPSRAGVESHKDVVVLVPIIPAGGLKTTHKNCPSCICGKRARVQGDGKDRKGQKGEGPGTIAWAEHELAWSAYAARHGRDQSAQRIHERGGFGYWELTQLLGHEPETWVPAGAVAERER